MGKSPDSPETHSLSCPYRLLLPHTEHCINIFDLSLVLAAVKTTKHFYKMNSILP